MKGAIEGRELITLEGQGVLLRGTFHKPRPCRPGEEPILRDRVGVVFLNSLSIPRASTGDSAVYWAESLADRGYPVFRFDLPGLGDTAGVIPNELLDFINAGGYGPITAAKIEELTCRYGLSGVVLVGHCAGTVSAIFAAASSLANCKGLILMDPYFHLPQAVRSQVRRGLSDWALESNVGRLLSNVYDRLRNIARLFRGNSPPRNANFRLLRLWKQVAVSGMPILLLKAPARKAQGTKPRMGEFDYLQHVIRIAGQSSQVSLELVERTDHSFANQRGRLGVSESTQRWLGKHFPQPEPASAALAAKPDCIGRERYHECQMSSLQN